MTSEKVYFVDNNDSPTGESEDKLKAHNEDTKLHAAFSSYVFNEKGQFLVTRRAHSKKVWHGVWTNSCCGHPMPGETREDAVIRRLDYELGIKPEKLIKVVEKYVYKTPPYSGVIEHEFCPIYVVLTDSEVAPNPDEVEEYKWVGWDWYVSQIKQDPDDYSMFAKGSLDDTELGYHKIPKWSWWCKDQLKHLESSKAFNNYIDSIKS